MNKEDIRIVKEKIEPKIKIIKDYMYTIVDIKAREDGEKLHKQISVLTVENLLRPFTI